jgi:hypothetical protein
MQHIVMLRLMLQRCHETVGMCQQNVNLEMTRCLGDSSVMDSVRNASVLSCVETGCRTFPFSF